MRPDMNKRTRFGEVGGDPLPLPEATHGAHSADIPPQTADMGQ